MRLTVHLRGVGGQAVPFIVTMLGRRAAEAQAHFSSREVFGMAQRGGSVAATLHIETADGGADAPAEADQTVLLGLELLEGFRGLSALRPGEQAVISTGRVIPPGSWGAGAIAYPTPAQLSAAAAEHGIGLTLVDAPIGSPWRVVQAAIDCGLIPLGTRAS